MAALSWQLNLFYVTAVVGFVVFSRTFGTLVRRLQKDVQGERGQRLPSNTILGL